MVIVAFLLVSPSSEVINAWNLMIEFQLVSRNYKMTGMSSAEWQQYHVFLHRGSSHMATATITGIFKPRENTPLSTRTHEAQAERKGRVSRERGIVMGGSMAGLVTARILSDHYSEVIVVEQDAFGPFGEHRRGVPQSRFPHGVLASGLHTLEGFFPGLTQEAVNRGAPLIDRIRDAHWCFPKGEHARFESGFLELLLSRPLLEGLVRERVRRLTNVQFREGCQVIGLLTTSDSRRVTGIRTNAAELAADLVVDATGRGSRSPTWLEAMGYGRPAEEKIEVNRAISARRFRRSPDHLDGALFVAIPATPATGKGGIMVAQEGNSWIVAVNACCGATVPTELGAFIDFTRTLPVPYIYDVISQAEPIGEAHATRFPANVRRRYESMKRFPEGYLVLGDAICSFNPVYGQGMSVAALEAAALNRLLGRGSTDLAHRFFRQIADIVDIPWSIAAGNDLRMSRAVGSETPRARFFNWYMTKLHSAARHDPSLVLAFQKVSNLQASPSSLLTPGVIMRVFLAVPVQSAVRRTSKSFARGLSTLAEVVRASFT